MKVSFHKGGQRYETLILLFFSLSFAGYVLCSGFVPDVITVNTNGQTNILEHLDDYFYYELGCRTSDGGVDIVFCIDSTGSMGGTLTSIRTNIHDFVNALALGGYDFRLGGVPYGDGTNIWDFDLARPGYQMTDDTAAFILKLNACGAAGGGDGPEVQLDAMADAIRLYDWRPTALHILLNFTDAPFHYLGDGSGFSDETPEGVYDLVMATGTICFWAATPYDGTSNEWYRRVSLDSGGNHYPLTTPWSIIFPDVVSLIGESSVINIGVVNATVFILTLFMQHCLRAIVLM